MAVNKPDGKELLSGVALGRIIKSIEGKTDVIDVLNAVGSVLPEALPSEKLHRRVISGATRDIKINRTGEDPLLIAPTERAAMRTLDLKPLLLTSILYKGQWREEFLKKQPKRRGLGRLVEKAQNIGILPGNKNQAEKIDLKGAVKFLQEKLNNSDRIAKKHRYGRLTSGLELEIRKQFLYFGDDEELIAQKRKIDALQEIGLPVNYDALREVSLPYSRSMYEQLRALLLISEMGMIPDSVNIHLNVGSFLKLDENIFVLQQMAVAAGLFEKDILTHDDFHPLSEKNIPWAKGLYEGDNSSPIGLPFRVRKNKVLEFRWIGSTRDYGHVAKGLETFLDACEACSAYQMVEEHGSMCSEETIALAEVWSEMKTSAIANFEKMGFEQEDIVRFYYDAEKYARHESAIRHRVATTKLMHPDEIKSNNRNRSEMYSIFRNGRARVRSILYTEQNRGQN